MLSFSLNEVARRGTWTCVSCSNLSWSCQALIASSSRPLLAKTHQRKHSSSKPSSPPKDFPRAIDAPSETPVKEVTPKVKESIDKRPSARTGRRKPRDISQDAIGKNKYEALFKIPTVPSTQHLHPQDIHVASFFSIHRPISVTSSVPPASTSTAFSSIFDRKARHKPQPSDVIYTLSSAVDSLDSIANSPSQAQQPQQTAPEEFDLHATISQADHSDTGADGSQSPESMQSDMLHVNVQELVKHFRPFAPPPPPLAMGHVEEKAKRELTVKSTVKSYSAVLTILESTQPNGSKIYQTRTSSIREDLTTPALFDESQVMEIPPLPRQPFLNHMRERQRRWEEIRNGNGERTVWRAISVKRQRKLKMKKHKYKKLMQRTRNLRRRLDRN